MSLISQDFIVAFTPGAVWAGAHATGSTMVQIGAGGLSGSRISAATMVDPSDGQSKVFAVDGTDSIIATINVEMGQVVGGLVESWASAVSTRGVGEFPGGTAVLAPWLGRAVIGRPTLDGQQYFMSRNGNPLDWGFGAIPLATTPIAGRNSKAGVPGDTITSIIPTWDDLLFFGCSNSIWAMNGDPSFGGRIDNVSQKTGVLDQDAWALDNSGNLWVMGTAGLFVIRRGTLGPEDVASGRLDKVLRQVDLTDRRLILTFDPVDERLHILFTSESSPAPGRDEHWVYDIRNNAFWQWDYPADVGPLSAVEPTSGDPEQRRPLFAGRDGVIRRHSRLSPADDEAAGSTTIPTLIRFAPYESPVGNPEIMLTELQATGSIESGPLTWRLYPGQSREQLAQIVSSDANADRFGLWFGVGSPGFQEPVGIRLRAGSIALELAEDSLDKVWGIERITAVLAAAEARRRRS